MNPQIRHNASKNGIEVKYNGKPNPKIIETLRSAGFKYTGKGEYWWSVINVESLAAVNYLADNPVCTSCMDSVSALKRFNSLLGKKVDEPTLNPLHADVRAIIKEGKSQFLKELKEIDRILWLMIESVRSHGQIVPKLGSKQTPLKKVLARVEKSKVVKTEFGQINWLEEEKASFSVSKKKKAQKSVIDWKSFQSISDEINDYSEALEGIQETVFVGTKFSLEDAIEENSLKDLVDEIEGMPDWFEDLTGVALKKYKSFHNRLVKLLKGNSLAGLPAPQLEESALYGLPFIQDDSELSGEGLSGSGLTPYDIITNMILDKIKGGDLVWRKSWSAGSSGMEAAKNYVSKKAYKGVNSLMLNLIMPGKTSYWMTFNQIKKLGGQINKGARARPVFYYNFVYRLRETGKNISEAQADRMPDGSYVTIPFLKYYNVFNVGDVTGAKIKIPKQTPIPAAEKVDPIESAVSIISQMPLKPELRHGGDRAYYSSRDYVQMPFIGDFDKEQFYYSTLFHELVHSTGHRRRLDREMSGNFGTKKYAFEELIAEFGASFLCGEAGILYHTLDNTAAYIKSWSSKLTTILKKDNKFILRATAAAQKAADFIQAGGTKGKGSSDRKPVRKAPASKPKRINQGLGAVPMPVVHVPTLEDSLGGLSASHMPSGISNMVMNIDQVSAKTTTEKFKGEHPMFDFIGNIERKPKGSVAITLDAPQGSGKTRFVFQFANAMAGAGYRVLFASLEEHPTSALFIDKRNEYIDPKNYPMIDVVSDEQIEQLSDLDKLAEYYDVIIADSASKIRHFDLDHVRKSHDGKLFAIIYQRTTDGSMRGGSLAQFDGDAVAKIVKDADFRKNYVYWDKNRYEKKQGMRYSIFNRNIISDDTEI